jgi:hypothetical protein
VTRPTSLGNSEFRCSDETGAVANTFVRPGSYKAFVWAFDGAHGHQWMGLFGGVGQFENARTITVAAGQTLALPQIRLDAAGGAVTGTVIDEDTGAPLTFGWVALTTFNSGQGPGQGVVEISNGSYTMTGLGPYRWNLHFGSGGYASEWSGDSATRVLASPVRVKPDQPVVYDVELGRGLLVTGTVTDANGTSADFARITFVNVNSRDETSSGDLPVIGGSAEHYAAAVKGWQRVKLSYYAQVGLQFYSGWVGGDSFEDADTFLIPAQGTRTINVTVTQPAPF